MTYPPTLPTKQVTFGRAIVLETGIPIAMRVTVTASRSLVHRPTGTPLVSITALFLPGTDGTGSISIPICDSPEMGIGNGASIVLGVDEVTHTYTAGIDYMSLDGKRVLRSDTRGPFVVLSTDPEPMDLDDIITSDASTAQAFALFRTEIAALYSAVASTSAAAASAETNATNSAISADEAAASSATSTANANGFSIGTVVVGPLSATITGTAPDRLLNLSFPEPLTEDPSDPGTYII